MYNVNPCLYNKKFNFLSEVDLINSPWISPSFSSPTSKKLYVGIFRTWKSNRSVHFLFDVINAILSYTIIQIMGMRESSHSGYERFLNENGKFIIVSESLNSRSFWNRNSIPLPHIFHFVFFFPSLYCSKRGLWVFIYRWISLCVTEFDSSRF